MKVSQANKIILNPYITEKTFELVETKSVDKARDLATKIGML